MWKREIVDLGLRIGEGGSAVAEAMAQKACGVGNDLFEEIRDLGIE